MTVWLLAFVVSPALVVIGAYAAVLRFERGIKLEPSIPAE